MKNPNLKEKNLYTEADMNYNFKSAVLQGIVMCMTALEWHYGWRGKRLTDLYENVKAIAEMPPIFGKHPSAKEQILHLKEKYGIDLEQIHLQVEVQDGRKNEKGAYR